tara:strand:+ start:183 stop:371 length:189 start_codon:yes stop_codon:yes gene_type:complete
LAASFFVCGAGQERSRGHTVGGTWRSSHQLDIFVIVAKSERPSSYRVGRWTIDEGGQFSSLK